PEYGFLGGLGRGVFISISAFCNAGFDLMGNNVPFSSLTEFSGDIVVNLTVIALIFIGGLGFFVWSDIYTAKSFKNLSVFSKLVLIVSLGLLVMGALCFFVFEYNNPETMAEMPFRDKILASFFQSMTARTAGFNTINLGGMTDISIVIMCMLMFVGGASGSTAGGVKVGTLTVAACAVFSALKGENHVNVMGRRFSRDTVMQSFALIFVSFTVIIISALTVSAVDSVPFLESLFEVTSAFCTVGVTTGITTALSPVSLCLLMFLMFLGRVGFMTATYALFLRHTKVSNKIQYPEVKMIIG
ncbi:MAG: TrkH family potassium uptake protein, partial [Clostridia bacterium]|nr:TrkH family potassium uptake protein [Clostridia bacterium]